MGSSAIRLAVVVLFVLLAASYAHAEYGVLNAPASSRFNSVSAEWFRDNGVSVVYIDDTHYEITFADSSPEGIRKTLSTIKSIPLASESIYGSSIGSNSISSALSVIGSAAVTYVSTTSGCEAYYYSPGGLGGVDYCVKKCGTASTWNCISTSCTTYNQQRFAAVSNNLCSSCSFRSTAESTYLSNCPSTYCFNSSPQYYFQNLKLPYEVVNPYYYLEGLVGACSKCYYQNRTTPCPGSCTEAGCDGSNYYGAWEYYCSGSEKRQHRRYYDYTCSGGSCSLASQNYVDDSLVENCTYGCSAGTCNSPPACSNECASGQIRCNGSYSQGCGNYDADSCYEWPSSTSGSGNTYCSYGCNSGTGQCNPPSCTSECSSGQIRCNGSYSQTCGNYDADSCYEWPSSTSGSGNTSCSYGCNSSTGQCNSCTNDCSSGQLRCNGSYSQSCGNYDADSCYEWPASTSGSGNTYCSSGCTIGTGQCTSCTSHASYSCYSSDIYWYNSCNQREDLKQDCGDSYCNSWGSNYCKNGDVYHSRTCYGKGCTAGACYSNASAEEQLVQGCNGNGCTNGTCNACTNECSSGQSRCWGTNGNTSQACGNYDSDSCYEWPSSTSGSGNTSCSYGCNSSTGQCNYSGNCYTTSSGSETYCSTSCKCNSGEGDCDSDSECNSGLDCVNDIGSAYGWSSSTDVCLQSAPISVTIISGTAYKAWELPRRYKLQTHADAHPFGLIAATKCNDPALAVQDVPHYNVELYDKLYAINGTRSAYNLHIGRLNRDSQECTVVYITYDYQRNSFCKEYCGSKRRNPGDVIRAPPVQYPYSIPTSTMDALLKHHNLYYTSAWPIEFPVLLITILGIILYIAARGICVIATRTTC